MLLKFGISLVLSSGSHNLWEFADLNNVLDSVFLSFFGRFIASQGCIKPLCDLLSVMDSKIVMVALNGLENVLKVGESEAKSIGVPNKYALEVEECFGKHSTFAILLSFVNSVW